MNANSRKTNSMRFFSSNLFLILLVVALFATAFACVRAYYQDFAIREQITALEGQLNVLKQKNLSSLDALSYAMSDSFVEEKARMELNLKKPGEHVLIVPRQLASAGPQNGASALQRRSNALQWWYYFFDSSL